MSTTLPTTLASADERARRVRELRRRIQAGEYHPDPVAVAEAVARAFFPDEGSPRAASDHWVAA